MASDGISRANVGELYPRARHPPHVADASATVGTIFFLTGAAVFHWVLFRARLVPRWLSGWGLVAIVLCLVVGVVKVFGTVEVMSTIETVVSIPLGVQDMDLALRLIIAGFRSDAEIVS